MAGVEQGQTQEKLHPPVPLSATQGLGPHHAGNAVSPNEPPVPALQKHGFNGGINAFNQRVEHIFTTYKNAYGTPPSPGLTLNLATSPVANEDIPKMFSVPQNQLAAKNRGIAKQFGHDPTAPIISNANELANQITASAVRGNFKDFIVQNHDLIHSLSYQNKQAAATITGAIFKARRFSMVHDLEMQVAQGKITSTDMHQQLMDAGFLPSQSLKPAKGVLGFVAKGIGQVADSLVHSPAGVYQLGKAAGLDTADWVNHPFSPHPFHGGTSTHARTGEIAKAVVKSTAQDVEHPGRNPGYLFLDILGFASPIASGAARVGEAGRVLRAGEGAGAAAKALATKPLSRATLNYGGYTEEMPLSQNPLVAAAQKGIIKVRQARANKALEGNPPAGLGFLKLGVAGDVLDEQLSFAKKVSREADARKRIDQTVKMTLSRELQHAAGATANQTRIGAALERVGLRLPKGGLTRGEQKAIQVLSWDDPNPLAAERAFHERAIAEGIGDPKAHKRQLADLKLAENVLGNPSQRFKKALALTKQVAEEQQAMKIKDLGLLAETAEGRIARAGQVLRGENPNHVIVYQGTGHTGELDVTKNVDTLYGDHGIFVTENGKYASGYAARSNGGAAQVRLFHVDKSKLLDEKSTGPEAQSIADKLGSVLTPEEKSVVDLSKVKSGADVRLALDKAGETLGYKNPAQFFAEVAQRAGYHGVDIGRNEKFIFDAKQLLPVKNRLEGGEPISSESFYLKTEPRGKGKRGPVANAGYFPVRAGGFGIPSPRDLAELKHEFTGKALTDGDYRIDATGLASEAYARTVRAVAVRAEHSKLWDAASPTPRTRWDIPIRDAQKIPDKLREVVSRLDEGSFLPADAKALPNDMRDLIQELYPDPNKLTAEEIPNVKWIDSRLLGEGSRLPHQAGLGAATMQAIQTPFRFTALYLRPAYILNKLGNHAMLWFDQGIHTVPNFIRAMAGKSAVGEENMRTIYELVGAGKSRSFVATGSGHVSNAVANFWNRVADRDERAAAFIHYAKLKGYNWNAADITRLLKDEASRADLNEVTRRANKSLVEFDNLLPIEKNYIRHLIFVYPWVSRSAVYSIRAILEHPTKTDILSKLGEQEYENDPIFKAAPAWFKRVGYIPIGWNGDGTPRIVNPTSVNTFSTLGDFVAMARGATVGDKYASAEDFLGPAPKFFVHAATGRDEFGNQYPGSQWWDAAKEVLGGLPQLSAYDKAHPKAKKAGSSFKLTDRSSLQASLNSNLKKTVLSPGWLDGYGTLIAGGLSPRELNLSALAARYWADQDAATRHARELDLLNRALDIQAQTLGKPVDPAVREAVRIQSNIDFKYKNFLKTTGRAPTDKERALFTIDYLQKNGNIKPSVATAAKAQLENEHEASAINTIKNTLLNKYAGGMALRLWDRDVRALASFTPEIFNEKAANLFSQGLADQRKYNVPQEKLYAYGRKYVDFMHEAEALRKSGASAIELKAFQDAHDKPVDGLPSFVRISWANQTQKEQQDHLNSITTQNWSTLSGFDKTLLGRPSDPKVTAGWVKLNEIIDTQRKALAREGRTFPSGYARTLAKYVEKYYDAPGLVRDFDFAKQPEYQRLKMLKPIQDSPNKSLWNDVFTVAGAYSKYLHATDDTGAHSYSSTQVRQMWKDYISSAAFQSWLNSHPDFKDEIQNYGKNTLEGLIG